MADKFLQIRNSAADFLVFTRQSGEDGIEVRISGESVWLTQKGMAQLFDCSTDNISLHLKNIFKSGELSERSVIEQSSATAADGKTVCFNVSRLCRTAGASPYSHDNGRLGEETRCVFTV